MRSETICARVIPFLLASIVRVDNEQGEALACVAADSNSPVMRAEAIGNFMTGSLQGIVAFALCCFSADLPCVRGGLEISVRSLAARNVLNEGQ